MPADQETAKELTAADHVKGMLDSEGWRIVKEKFDARILDLQNIHNLDMTDPTTLATQLAARKMAVDVLWTWLRNDVVGFVEQQETNNPKVLPIPDEFIERE